MKPNGTTATSIASSTSTLTSVASDVSAKQAARAHISRVDGSANFKYFPIQVLEYPGRGFGVEALCDIPAHEVVLENMAKPLPITSKKINFEVAQFLFVNPEYYKEPSHEANHVMVCGEMVFLNHSTTPNCIVNWRMGPNRMVFAQLKTIRPVTRGTELTIRYTDEEDYKKQGAL